MFLKYVDNKHKYILKFDENFYLCDKKIEE